MARTPRPRRRGPAANKERGEHSLTLAGVTYRLRPSFAAVQAIEEELGTGLVQLAGKANRFDLPLADLGLIAAEFIRAGADPEDAITRAVSPERIAELIFEEGTGTAFAAVTLALTDAVMGGRTASGEAKAAATTETREPIAAA